MTSVAWDLGAHARPAPDGFAYALEGAVFSSGATIQWLRDGLRADRPSRRGRPARGRRSPANDGVYLVPAFTGLGSPWWDPEARGAVIGITKGTGRAHLARAAVEAIAYQCRDVLDAMADAAGRPVSRLRADGGAAVMDLLLQLQADQCGVPVIRPRTTEVTALGAAMLAGLAEGVWGSLADLQSLTSESPRCSSRRRDVAGLTPTTPAGSRRSIAPGTGSTERTTDQ